MSRLSVVCSALLLVVSAPLLADEASHAAQAKRLLELTHAKNLTVPVYTQVRQAFEQRFAEAQAPDSKKALLESYQAKANVALDKAIGWQKLEPQMISLYSAAFTEAELKELIAFYQSPTGSKVLARMPALMAQSVQISQSQLQPAVPEVNKLLTEMSAELAPKQP